jgi:hypothetical protein
VTRHRRQFQTVAVVALAILALGSIAVALTAAWPSPAESLFPHDPHPTLAGTGAEVVDILSTNLPVLVLPLLFAGAAAGRPGPWRAAGDLVTLAIAAVNSLAVGAALALHGAALLPYLPHLPIEAAALTVACSAWASQRSRRRPLTVALVAVVVLAVAAALIEVYATPHVSR